MPSNWRTAATGNWRGIWPTTSPMKRRSWTVRLAVSWEGPGRPRQALEVSVARRQSSALERRLLATVLRKDDHMKDTKCMAIVTLLVLGVGAATAQSLGDYARTVRKNKPETTSTGKVYDNDNLPTTET